MLIPILVGVIVVLALGASAFALISLFKDSATVFMTGYVIFTAILWIIIGLWPRLSLRFAVKGRAHKIGIIESFKKGWFTLHSYIWVSLLSFLAVLGGLILLVVPGIIFAVWFSLSTYILVAENVKGSGALERSKELIEGYWWEVLGRFVVLGLIIFGLGFILGFIPIVGQIVIGILLPPFSIVYIYLLYEDLKELKETSAGQGQTL